MASSDDKEFEKKKAHAREVMMDAALNGDAKTANLYRHILEMVDKPPKSGKDQT